MDRPALDIRRERRSAIGQLADRIEKPSKHRLPDRHAIERAGCVRPGAAAKPGCIFQRDGTHGHRVEVLLDLGNQRMFIALDFNAGTDCRQRSGGKTHIDNRAVDRRELTRGRRISGGRRLRHHAPACSASVIQVLAPDSSASLKRRTGHGYKGLNRLTAVCNQP